MNTRNSIPYGDIAQSISIALLTLATGAACIEQPQLWPGAIGLLLAYLLKLDREVQ